MTFGQDKRVRRGLEAVMRDLADPLPEEPWPERLPPEVEELLWEYAMGLADPAEEDRAIAIVARSARAEETLAQIRRSMVAARMALPIEVAEAVPNRVESLCGLAWQKVRAVLAALGGELRSLAAVVVNTEDRLIWAQQAPDAGLDLRRGGTVRLAVQPVLLDLAAESGVAEPGARALEIRGSSGLSATVRRISKDRVDVVITVSDPAAQGTVRMFRLTPEVGGVEEVEVGIGERLREGKAVFEDCPGGMLRIVAPDGGELSIFLETGNR